ncbi:DUF2339 domain-containing protein [Adhaeribacter aquaticus]|uniref:DUF2339 domain-containing protein n=1 Tax=Adhaeribacter aquaticus TaxID=299567 RepID=UPI000408FD09|nr:DUF2339 domain-containing protein [Adhaeribacter aquaticus]
MFNSTNILIILCTGIVIFLFLVILKKLSLLVQEIKTLREELNKQKESLTFSGSHLSITKPAETATTSTQAKGKVSRNKFFFLHQRDWEKFIGENLINKIGIAILVLGIGFFVRFAIEQNWINEVGRVLIGLGSGALLLAVAHRLRHGYQAFSSVLIGGGLAVLYFTIALAFHQYHLLSQQTAFLWMVGITGLSVFLALLYNRRVLAILALLGGFTAPFMTSAGGSNYVVLFVYILILDIGMLVLAYFKRWSNITLIAYLATVILFLGWLFAGLPHTNPASYFNGWVFSVLFYLIFLAMDIIYKLGRVRHYSNLEIWLLWSNTTLFYIIGIYLLSHLNAGAYLGVYTGALAILNAGTAWLLFTKTLTDRKVIFLLGGAAISFIYLAILLELLFQLRTSVLTNEVKLFITVIYHYLFIGLLLRYGNRILTILQLKWLLMLGLLAVLSYFWLALFIVPDIRNAYIQGSSTGSGPFLLHYASLILIIILLIQGNLLTKSIYQPNHKLQPIRLWFTCAAVVFLLSTELDHIVALTTFGPGQSLPKTLAQNHRIGFAILWGILSFGFMLLGMQRKIKSLRLISLTLFFITLLKLFLFDIRTISAGGRITAFILLGILLLVVSFLYQKLKGLILEEDTSNKSS